MKKLKKFLLSTLSLALVAVLSVAGTLAYLQDDDSDVNVMTMGNVKIEQLEYERVVDENGNPVEGVNGVDFESNYGIDQSYKLQKFTQAKPAYPAVYANGRQDWEEFQQLWNQVGAPGSNDIFDDSMKNVIDKFVFVKNTGKSDAYYRTIIAIEEPEGLTKDAIHTSFNTNSRFDAITQSDDFTGEADKGEKYYFIGHVTINGVRYGIYNMTYNQVLTPGEVSRPSLLQVFLDPNATNEDSEKFGETWDILVKTQAVQTKGFESAQAALNAAFGKIDSENIANAIELFGDVESTKVITSVDEEKKDLGIKDNTIISQEEDITLNFINNYGKDVTIYGNEKKLNIGTAGDYGFIGGEESNTVFENVDINAAGGGIAVISSKATFNSGSITIESESTAQRYFFYVVGAGSEVTINDGEFSFVNKSKKRGYVYVTSGNVVYINGGVFGGVSQHPKDPTAPISGDGTVIITGGTFGFDPTQWVADGYEAVKDGSNWIVQAK